MQLHPGILLPPAAGTDTAQMSGRMAGIGTDPRSCLFPLSLAPQGKGVEAAPLVYASLTGNTVLKANSFQGPGFPSFFLLFMLFLYQTENPGE